MNYALHYSRLIARARGRFFVGYRERHHVVPRCMGGGDEPENLVDLTAEEHYVAHQLLVKMHPDVHGLAYAAVAMAKRASGNKAYGWLRRRHARAKRDGKLSPDTRAKMSTAKRGNTNCLGRKLSPETRAKIGAASSARHHTLETREKISAAKRGRLCSLETRSKIAAAHLGKKMPPPSEETRAKLSAALRGNQRMRGKKLSLKTRANMRASWVLRKLRAQYIQTKEYLCLPG